jgi:hypothetical protein
MFPALIPARTAMLGKLRSVSDLLANYVRSAYPYR